MKPARPAAAPAFDHGAALRVPPLHDVRSWRKLWAWLGEDGLALDGHGAIEVTTEHGPAIASPGDWIVLSVSGSFHVARCARPANA
jgi:hypothetical protein